MSPLYMLVAFGYLGLTVAVIAFEARRIRHTGVDALTIFLFVCLLQTGVSGIAIYGTLPFVNPREPTGNPFFDRVFQTDDFTASWLVLVLNAWFLVCLYLGNRLVRTAIRPETPHSSLDDTRLELRPIVITLVLIGAFFLTITSFLLLGTDMLNRYANLVLFRSLDTSIQRTAFNANAFALTQTWSWLSIVAVAALFERKGRWVLKTCTIVLCVLFAVLGASRRSLFLPMLLAYLTGVAYTGRWRIRWLALSMVPLLFWLAFGKELLASLAFNVPIERVGTGYSSWASGLLRAASEAGISQVESVGTVSLVHIEPRYGVDHLLSLAQRFPEGLLGLDINWPDRIVRTTTAIFLDPSAQDIPPGFAGQMWLDFRLLGPVFWGLLLGGQIALIQEAFRRVRRTPVGAAVMVVLVFIVALPVNSGSYDFTFSVDILALVAILALCVVARRTGPDRLPTAGQTLSLSPTAPPASFPPGRPTLGHG